MSRKLFLKVNFIKSNSSVQNWVLWENYYLKWHPNFLSGVGQKPWAQAETLSFNLRNGSEEMKEGVMAKVGQVL